jgi:hypothetical protein
MRRTTLFFYFDTLGYSLIQEAGFLADLAPHRYRLRTVLGYPCATLPTVLTGVSPREHGCWMPFSYAPDDSPFRRFAFLRHIPHRITDSPRIRARIARLMARRLHWTADLDLLNVSFGVLPLFDAPAKRDLFEPGALAPCATAIDRLHGEHIPFFLSDRHATDAQNIDRAAAALERHEVPFILLHLRELDSILRQAGPHSDAAREKLRGHESAIRRLYEAACRDDGLVRLYVGAAHGITQVKETLDLRSRVESARLALGADYLAFYDPTMVRFWFAEASVRHRIMATLADVDAGRWLLDDQLRIEGIYFPDRRFGEAVFLLEPGTYCFPNDHHGIPVAATDGYYPDEPASWGAFCVNFPLEIPPRLIGDLSSLILEGARWAR